MPISRLHVIHADGRHGLHTRIDLRRDQRKVAASAYADDADPIAVDELMQAGKIDAGTEILNQSVPRATK